MGGCDNLNDRSRTAWRAGRWRFNRLVMVRADVEHSLRANQNAVRRPAGAAKRAHTPATAWAAPCCAPALPHVAIPNAVSCCTAARVAPKRPPAPFRRGPTPVAADPPSSWPFWKLYSARPLSRSISALRRAAELLRWAVRSMPARMATSSDAGARSLLSPHTVCFPPLSPRCGIIHVNTLEGGQVWLAISQ
jgi:hypothetical protein